MKKVLFVVHTLQVGGAEKVLVNLLKYIDKKKFDVTVLALVNDGVYVNDIKNIKGVKYRYVFDSFFKKIRSDGNHRHHKITVKIMSDIWKIYLRLMKRYPGLLYRLSVREKYDVEIAFLEGKVSKFVSSSKNKKSTKIAWIHTDINNLNNKKIFKNIEDEKECYSKFDKIICVSNEVKERFSQRTGLTENIFVQTNPIDSQNIEEKMNEPIEENLNNKGLVLCSVGRLVKEKGYDRLLEVHNKLIKEGIIHTLWIVGEGEKRKELEKYIEENNLKETVNLIGYSNNPYKYVKKADIFVSSSRVEGLSSAILEAAIIGKPIVATDCPGTEEILGNDGQAGLIVENDTEALYEGIKSLLDNISLMNKYKENILKRRGRFDIQNVVKQIESIIDS